MDRFREAHANADFDALLASLNQSEDMPAQIATTLLQRRPDRSGIPSRFLLSPEREGLFVVANGAVVTFLRLGLAQQEFCRRVYPRKRG